MDERKAHKFNLWGWILFVVSALFFIWASLRSGDVVSLIGGLFFLIACFIFLIPMVWKKNDPDL
jgi:energy-coupling factor transporter transmembrane protein EcfT